MNSDDFGYRPEKTPARAAIFVSIVAVHGFILSTIALLGGTPVIVERSKALFIQLVAEPPRTQPPLPASRVPLPVFRKPDIQPPEMPIIEGVVAVRFEEHAATPPAIPPAVPTNTSRPPVATSPVEPPRYDLAYLNNPSPGYPPISRRLREEGRVMLRVRVGATGLVEAIEVIGTSGFPRLDQTALSAVRQWRFVPARAGDHAVAGWALVPVVFQLNG